MDGKYSMVVGNNVDFIFLLLTFIFFVDAIHDDGSAATHGVAEGAEAGLGEVVVVGHIELGDGRIFGQCRRKDAGGNVVADAIGRHIDLAEGGSRS